MKYHFLFIIIATTMLASCSSKEILYTSLSESEYRAQKALDTIMDTGQLLVTCTGTADNYNNMKTILVRKSLPEGKAYFKLQHDVYFENSKVLVQYQGFFSSGEDGPFQKDGIWVHTDFYNDETGKGLKFAVDSLPQGYPGTKRPKAEGIYRYDNYRLRKVSASQSEEAFHDLKTDGFYFIPNSGRFFKRHSAAELQ